MKKYYAVRRGRTVGILNSWEECKNSVDGFERAEYKSFTKKSDAESYLNDENLAESVEFPPDTLIAYVDGSYNVKTKVYGYGCVIIFPDGRIEHKNGSGSDPEAVSSRNIAGELCGAMFAVSYAAKNGFKNIRIYHDYEGIAAWFTGRWKAQSYPAKKYLFYLARFKDIINITFEKVVAHTGVEYNEAADRLAKEAAGIDG